MLDELAEFAAFQQSRLQSKQVCRGTLSATLPTVWRAVLCGHRALQAAGRTWVPWALGHGRGCRGGAPASLGLLLSAYGKTNLPLWIGELGL